MAGVNTEFVVASSKVLDERVTADHDRRGPVVCILRAVVGRGGEKFVDNTQQRCSQIRGDLPRSFATGQQCFEERGRSCKIAPLRHVHVDHLAVLIDAWHTYRRTPATLT